jgi:hypothetical protein
VITVSCVPNRHHHYAFVDLLADYNVGPVPGVPMHPGGILFAWPADGSGPASAPSEAVHFGWMIEGDERWGFLGDHDVQHMGAHGSILINGGGIPKSPSPQGGSNVDLGESTRHVLMTTYWSEGTLATFSYPMPTYVSPGVGTVEFGGPYGVTYRVAYSGDYCVVEMTTSMPEQRFLDMGNVIPSRTTSVCQFLERYASGTGFALRTSRPFYGYGGSYSDLGAVFGAVLPNSFAYSQPCNNDSVVSRGALDSVDGSLDIYMAYIVNQLKNGYLARYVATKVFGENPCQSDFDKLGEQVLAQMKIVDADVLLTAFDLLRLKSESASWENLAKLFASYPSTLFKRTARSGFKLEFVSKSFPELFRKISRGTRLSSNAFLGQRYGILPNLSDAAKLIQGFASVVKTGAIPQRLHSRRSSSLDGPLKAQIVTTETLTAQVETFPSGFLNGCMSHIQSVKRWGMYPSFSAIWDIVPYSFVIDWFTGINKSLRQVDEHFDMDYYPIQYSISGQKRSWNPSVQALWPDLPVTGDISFTMYTRVCAQALPLPPVTVGKTTPLNIRWAEATALIVQRLA